MGYPEFCEKFIPLGDRLYRIAFYLLESEADAKDVLQDLYLKLWNSRDRLDAVGNPKGYCTTLLRNLCIDRIRQRSRFHHSLRTFGMTEAGSGSTEWAARNEQEDASAKAEERIDAKQRLEAVKAAMAKLSEGQRQVLKMRILDNLSYDEIAARTGKSKLTLRVLLSTARKTLKEQT